MESRDLQSVFNPDSSNGFIEEFLEKLDGVRGSIELLRDFLIKAIRVVPLPCHFCSNKRCSKPCKALEALLPKPYAGKGHRERNINLDFDEFEGSSAGSQVVFEDEQHQMQTNQSRFKSVPIVTSLDIFEEYKRCWKIFTDKQREVLGLKHYQGKTTTQIAKELKKRPIAVRFADILTSSFGTIAFLVINIVLFVGWIIINSNKTSLAPFDPFPFLLLSVVVSSYAILLSIVVLISQNRQSQIDSLRQELELQVELIAEREITKILQILKKIASAQGVKIDDNEFDEMIKEIDTSYIERKLQDEIEKSENLGAQLEAPIEKIEKKIKSSLEK